MNDRRPQVTIGMILPLSGPMADVGSAFRDAANLALQEIPPDSACQYRVVFEDDALTPSKAASAAHKLMSADNAQVLVSTWSYGASVVAPLAEGSNRLHFAAAWDERIVDGKQSSFISLSAPKDFLPFFLRVFNKQNRKNIAVLGMNESGSLFMLNEIERLAPRYSISIQARETFDYGTNDFRSVVTKLKQLKLDYIFLNLAMPEIEIFMRQAKDQKVTIPITSITGFDVIHDLSLAEGRWYVSDSTPPQSFQDRLKEKFHQDRTYGVGNYFDFVNLTKFLYEPLCTRGKVSTENAIIELDRINSFPSVFGQLIRKGNVLSYSPVYRIIDKGVRKTLSEVEIPAS